MTVEVLAHIQFMSSISVVVKTMTGAVLAMQQEYCERSIQHKIESKDQKLREKCLWSLFKTSMLMQLGSKLCKFTGPHRDRGLIALSVVYIDSIISTQSIKLQGQ